MNCHLLHATELGLCGLHREDHKEVKDTQRPVQCVSHNNSKSPHHQIQTPPISAGRRYQLVQSSGRNDLSFDLKKRYISATGFSLY